MIRRRRLITAAIGSLLLAGFVRAEMMPICHRMPEQQSVLSVWCSSEEQRANPVGLYGKSIFDDFALRTIPFPTEAAAHIEKPAKVSQEALILEGGPGSMSLCLYALMGLGLCGAPHWIRKLSLCHLPEWYHGGGPFQIGHSFAATPKSLSKIQVCCYLPPDDVPAEDSIPRYCLGIIVSCWRKSQFTPDVIASRGPP